LTHLLGYEKHAVAGRKSGNSRTALPAKHSRPKTRPSRSLSHATATGSSSCNSSASTNAAPEGFDELILALYARGMTTRDIQDLLRQKYAVEVSPQFISDICGAVSAGVAEWRERPLAAVWPIVYFDALHCA
jgi:putative transposase